MPMGIVGEDDHPEDSDYRFVVLGHPELGEFLDWDTAVAKAWSVTPPGRKRVDVTLAPKGVQQLKTSDPDSDDDESSPMDGIIFDFEDPRIHQVKEFTTDGTDILVAHTYCGLTRGSNEWATYNKAIDGDRYQPCSGCHWPGHRPLST
jgi:hypothetical protein